MKARQVLRRGLGVAAAAAAMLVVVATPASAGEDPKKSKASNGDGWVDFISDGDVFHVNDTKVDGDAVWAELSWYKSGDGWHFRTVKSTDNGDPGTHTKFTPWNIPEGAIVFIRACGSVKEGSYSNSDRDNYLGVGYDCGPTRKGEA
jgi:hypothetical protein